jgi:V/A-type H+-transporting ATPase subunit E
MASDKAIENQPSNGAPAVAYGVTKLVARLREEGVEEGRREAAEIREAAKREADEILNAARAEAEALRSAAKADAEKLQQSAEDALRVAGRDALLSIKEQLTQAFSNLVREDVAGTLDDDGALQQLVLAVAGQASASAGMSDKSSEKLTVRLPARAATLDELRKTPEATKEGTLAHFVAKKAAGMLRDGVTLQLRGDRRPGIRVRSDERGLELALTDEEISDLLLAHIQPRFRALVEGLIRG